MLQICDHPGCATLTLGTFCIFHEPPVRAERFPRGRPYPRRPRALPISTGLTGLDPAASAAAVEQAMPAGAVSLGGGA